MNDHQKKILAYWDAWIYEHSENETEMAEYLVRRLGKQPQNILEAACGTGKLCIPLAQAGHNVTGFDCSADMLRLLQQKAGSLANLHIHRADMLLKPWGSGFDAVLLGANLLVNIVTDRDYKRAQKNLLERAGDALKTGGLLFIDYDCPSKLSEWNPAITEWVCFEGTDDHGTYGKYIVINGSTNDRTRCLTGGG